MNEVCVTFISQPGCKLPLVSSRRPHKDTKINSKECLEVPMEKPKKRILFHSWAYKHAHMHEYIERFVTLCLFVSLTAI